MSFCGDNWRNRVGGFDRFHLLTADKLNAVLEDGRLRPRSQGVTNEYSRNALVDERSRLVLDGGLPLVECVPFYLHPLQPMFVDLRRRGRIEPEHVVGLGLDSSRMPGLLTYSTNPAYDGSHRVASVTDLDCDPTVHSCWGWRRDSLSYELNERRMVERQAESLLPGSLHLGEISTVVGLRATEIADVLTQRFGRQLVVWETDLTVFPGPCSHGNDACLSR